MRTQLPSPLLERGQEIDRLMHAWREAKLGRGATWLLCAEAGGGKSRLASELAARVDARVLWGAAEPISPPEPYVAIVSAIPGFQPAESRTESVARAVALLEAAAAGGPVLCVLDDLHFADEGTIAVIVRLSAACANRPWLILGAFRPGEGAAALHPAVTELVAQGRAQRLDLAPLSREAVGTLVTGLRGQTVDADEVDAIFADSGGNPWFVEALAGEQGAVSAVRDRMLLRLDRVEAAVPGANAVLAVLAPATRPLSQIVVATLCAGTVPGLRRVLAGLRDSGLLRETGSGWGFRHELLRRSLMEAMIIADQQDAHRALAEALDGQSSAAELAMHFAAAGDERAAAWALRAAREANAVDAHAEALGQLERALSFPLEPEERRTALRAAALQTFYLGRHAISQAFAEAALAIPGGEPETRSRLHQRAADAARLHGDGAAANGHMDAAEHALEGRPVSRQMINVAVARILQASVRAEPARAQAAAERALCLIRELNSPETTAGYELEARSYLGLSLIAAGDPAGFAAYAELAELGARNPRLTGDVLITTVNAYTAAVPALFHAEAAGFRAGLDAGMQRHGLGWVARAEPYHILELVQRGLYAEAQARIQRAPSPEDGSPEQAVLLCALALYEARAGSLARAESLLGADPPAARFVQAAAMLDLARLELTTLTASSEVGALAERVYATAEPRRFARVAGAAAVALAHAGRGAPAVPAWLVAASPLCVFWDWAAGIERGDAALLRDVAARLVEMDCPYESALARRDAGDLGAAYRALGAIGAGEARRLLAERLRTDGRPIPRRTHAEVQRDGLTETERMIVRFVASGAPSAAVAETLCVSVRTVDSHLARIYRKTGQRGRVALANWWRDRAA
jgi:DNA-binding CsgD family transcriptional regulator